MDETRPPASLSTVPSANEVQTVNPSSESPLVIVANRLPVQAPARGRGPWTRSPGGLADALHNTLVDRGGVWIGWPGGRQTVGLPKDLGYDLQPVALDAGDLRGYYDGFSNATLWPLYHDVIRQPVYHRAWWHDYHRVNARFADAVAATAAPNAAVWIHDYHLQLVPALVRERRPDLRIGFFLHIPFPPADLFARLPWRQELLDGVAGADLVGFQTPRDAENFCEAEGRFANPNRASYLRSSTNDKHIDAFPVSIDYEHWNEISHLPEVEKRVIELREQLGNPRAVLLGVDRLDYTKGIEQRLHAFRELLTEGRLAVPDAVLVQVASPSRDRVSAYRNERGRIEQLVGEINGDFAKVGTPAVHYIHQPLEPAEVAPLYQAADVMLVTPIRDGMNLVAKEFVASRYADHGVLVLSEFAGAAHELTDALLINPHDIEGIKRAILTALSLPEEEVIRRMRALRLTVKNHTVFDWAKRFLDALALAG
jgi:trehalose 6-phosphate synthase